MRGLLALLVVAQSTPSFMVGAGLPAQFQHYVADSAPVDRGEPTRGQSIRPAQ